MDENSIMLIVWLSVFLVALIAELATVALVSIWFCVGALAALAITYIPGVPWWGETIVFLGVSALTLILLRPLSRRMYARKNSKTNVDTLIGEKAKVVKPIGPFEVGEVKVGSVLWRAKPADASAEIPAGSTIEILSIQGNTLIVREVFDLSEEGK